MDVTSFGIDHNRLLRGIYVSRKDTVGDGVLTTFDVRMKEPNREMVMDTSVMHTIEHLQRRSGIQRCCADYGRRIPLYG